MADMHSKDFIDIFDVIDIISSSFFQDIKNTSKIIVLDSVNAIKLLNNKSEIQLRQTMDQRLSKIQLTGCCSILLGEEHTNENTPFFFEESISDTTMRLYFSDDDYKIRTLEVCKSRVIPCVRGENRFIIGQEGIVVYPSAPSYIAARQGRRYKAAGNQGKMESGVNGLDQMFGKKGIESGTITGFVGEAGTGKMELALCWLSNGVLANNQASIYVTFSKVPNNAISLLKNRASVVYRHFNDSLSNFKGFNNFFSIISLRTDGLTAGQIIHAINFELNKNKRLPNIHSVRIVIDSLTQLEYSSCSDEDNRSFLYALEEMVKMDSISCLLCYTRDINRKTHSMIEQKLINISNNHLEFKKVDVSGVQKTIVFTERSNRYSHPHEAMELIIDDGIKIEPNFLLFSDIRKGGTKAITTELFLHYEGKKHKEYNEKYLTSFVHAAVGEDVIIHNQLYPQISKNLIIRRGIYETSIRLVSVDDLDLDLLKEEDYHPIPTHLLNNSQFDYLNCVKKRIKTKTNKYYKALPFYVNVPVLLCNKKDINSDELEDVVVSWDNLVSWLERDDIDNDDQVPAFEFAKGVAENYNCMFLEILSYVVEKDTIFNAKNFYDYLKDDNIGKEAMFLFWRLCHKAHCLSKPHKNHSNKRDKHNKRSDQDDAFDILKINPKFSFCRTWFTSVYDIFERNEDEYNIRTLPDNGGVLGTWYLMVPKRGPSPDIAQGLCVSICDRDRSIERFENWIGIPPYISLGRGNKKRINSTTKPKDTIIDFARIYLSKTAEKAIVRTDIPKYNEISGLLSFYLQRILEIESDDKESLKKYIHKELMYAIKAINNR